MSTPDDRRVRRLSVDRWPRSLWDMELWNADRWKLSAVYRRFRTWIRASRWRRWTAWMAGIFLLLFVFPGVVGGIATALVDPSTASSGVDAGWSGVRDSSGVPLSRYMMVINHGDIFHPGYTILWAALSMVAEGYLFFGDFWIFSFDKVMSFGWMNFIATPLRATAKTFTGQIATPLVFVTAVTIGAFFVAYFIVRGLISKAAMQIVTMVVIAILSPVFLADPLAEVLSSDGILAQGRDVGVAVAAGLNGEGTRDSTTLVESMQGILTDNLVRKPLQVANFGHVVDVRPACKSAWSAGIMAGNEDEVKNGLKNCGDTAAYSAANKPSWAQFGILLLLCILGGVQGIVVFRISLKIMMSILDAIYHGFLAIFGLAAGGYIYGPTQTFTISNIVHGYIAAWRMIVEIVFVAVYLLFLGDLFEQADGQVVTVIVLSGIVMIIMMAQFKRISESVTRGGAAIAGKVSASVQGGIRGYGVAGGGGGGGGGYPSGGGGGTAAASHVMLMSTMGMQGVMAVSALSASPLASWLFRGRRNPLNRNSGMERDALLAGWENQRDPLWAIAQRHSREIGANPLWPIAQMHGLENQADPLWAMAQRNSREFMSDPNWLTAQMHGLENQADPLWAIAQRNSREFTSDPNWLQAQRTGIIERRRWRDMAREAALANGGLTNPRGVAAALTTLMDVGVVHRDALGLMETAGMTDARLNANVLHSWDRMLKVAPESTFKSQNLGYLAASTTRLRSAMESLARTLPGASMDEVVARIGPVDRALNLYREQAEAHVNLDELAALGEPGYRNEVGYVLSYLRDPTEAKIKALQEFSNGNFRLPEMDMKVDPDNILGPKIPDPEHENYELYQAKAALEAMGVPNRNGIPIPSDEHSAFKSKHAERMMDDIARREFNAISDSWDNFLADPGNPKWFREFRDAVNNAQRTERLATGMNRTPTAGLQSPGWGDSSNPGRWHAAFDSLPDHLNGP
ncbi:hypothetical protein ACFYXQ_19085 [Nocardia jiangxiensis]|uniref:TrbL/VirB6 plasmid conjugal transfer protein n=1 Tax=Nocardia jiangxiensis TaxID=282685 RepID=A0ABW6S0R0_9NOCA